MSVEELIKCLVDRSILRRTKLYGANETLDRGSPAFGFVENPNIWPIEETEFKRFVNTAIEMNEAERTCMYQKEIEREGPPNCYEYHCWENNVRYEVGTAKIRLSLKEGEPSLTVGEVTAEETYWTGY